ncbi:MAG: APC family permease [Vampirovibrionales bacterium]|nr:APC family permease [Vampirovibrionales bacterium]
MLLKIKRFIFGDPIPSQVEHHERLNVPLGLAVFASDILSSSAYATEEILLAIAGTSLAVYANQLSMPVAISICVLLAIVVASYRQVIRAYPESGGAYVVSRENLGIFPSLVAGAALLIDYVLTVAVSISAGVAALTSTGLVPQSSKVAFALIFIVLINFINLRGIRESGKVIAVPAYAFMLVMAALIGTGIYQYLTGTAVPLPTPSFVVDGASGAMLPGAIPAMDLALFLVLAKAFSHGCAALSGAEAVSNGVTAFRRPEDVNANRVLVLMAILLSTIFLGLTFLASVYNVMPTHAETVVSQIARAVFGKGHPLYYIIQFSTLTILILAANTSFAGFPRLASLMARDGFMPRQLLTLGDKLVFSNGITLLGFVSALMIILYGADTHALIPLYAIGVFITFTLAQAGMVLFQKRERPKGWRWGLFINAFGAIATGLVAILLAYEKFLEGAWLILVAMPLIILLFYKVKAHYESVWRQLALPSTGYCPVPIEHTVLVLVSTLHRGTIPALEYARTLSNNVEAVHVELNPVATENIKRAWEEWGCGIQLTVLQSEYRSLSEPLLEYLDQVQGRYEHDLVTVIVPEFVTKQWWHSLLHNQTAIALKTLLRYKKGVVVTTVRYFLQE